MVFDPSSPAAGFEDRACQGQARLIMPILEQEGDAPSLFNRQAEQGGGDLRSLVVWQIGNDKLRVIHELGDLFVYD